MSTVEKNDLTRQEDRQIASAIDTVVGIVKSWNPTQNRDREFFCKVPTAKGDLVLNLNSSELFDLIYFHVSRQKTPISAKQIKDAIRIVRGEMLHHSEAKNTGDSPLIDAVIEFAKETVIWTGPATQLLANLNRRGNLGNATNQTGSVPWPKSPTQLGSQLRSCRDRLQQQDVLISRPSRTASQRSWSIEFIGDADDTNMTDATRSSQHQDDHINFANKDVFVTE